MTCAADVEFHTRRIKPACESESDHLAVPLQEEPGRAASLFTRPPFIGHGGGWVLRVRLRAAAVSMRCAWIMEGECKRALYLLVVVPALDALLWME
jgi:hypothetical protein